MPRIFISYSSKDLEFVRLLEADLKERVPSATVFYDRLLAPGSSWANTLADELERADVVLAVLSPDYLESAWAQQEIAIAFDRLMRDRAKLIPLMVRPCSPAGLLGQVTWVDFTGDYEEAIASLVWGITGERPKQAKGNKKPGGNPPPGLVEAARQEVHDKVERFKAQPTALDTSTSRGPGVGPERQHGPRRCFVVMPFGDADLQVVYEDFVRPTLTDTCQLECVRGDDVFGSNVIMDDILKSMGAADLVLADLTRKNANVFYEVGIAHAMGKPVLLLAQSVDDVPFDLRHRRVLLYEYSPRGCKKLESTLRDNMKTLIAAL